MDSGTEVHHFDKQGTGISSIGWMDWTAGNFVSSNPRTGVIKIWNASQKQPLDSIRVSSSGILGIAMDSGRFRALLALSDGSVVSYNLAKRSIEYSTVAGHTDTVFDCGFCPTNRDIIATCSFDGTIKLWNITEMTLIATFFENGTVFYSCDWSPCGKVIVSSTISGEIIFWNVESGRSVARLSYHTKASYCIRWSTMNSNLICSTSADEHAIVFEVDVDKLSDPAFAAGGILGSSRKKKNTESLDVTVVRNIHHPAAVFGCAWNPKFGNYLCTGCYDGLVRVFDVMSSSRESTPVFILKGHTERVFSCSWSPVVPGLLATGSDDKNIIVWNVPIDDDASLDAGDFSDYTAPKHEDSVSLMGKITSRFGFRSSKEGTEISPTKILRGHRSNVRALGWNYEHPDILQSGSWDSTIRIWNVASGACVQVVHGHLLDVYTAVAHPMRPFTYVTTSRDTTIRIWEMEGIFTKMRIRVMLDFTAQMYTGSDQPEDGLRTKQSSQENLPDLEGTPSSVQDALISSAMQDANRSNSSNSLAIIVLKTKLRGKCSADLAVNLQRTKGEVWSAVNSKGKQIPESGASAGEVDIWSLCGSDPDSRAHIARGLREIFDFFCGSNGSVQLWSAAIKTLDMQPSASLQRLPSFGERTAKFKSGASSNSTLGRSLFTANGDVLLEGKVLEVAKSDALRIENLVPPLRRNNSDMDARYQDYLRAAASIYLKSGNKIKYCTIMVELGQWLEALAIAPAISLEFWKGLSFLYADFLAKSRSPDAAIPYLIASGHDYVAVDICTSHRDYASAMIIAKMAEIRTDLIPVMSGLSLMQIGDTSSQTASGSNSSTSPAIYVPKVGQCFAEVSSSEDHCRERTATEMDYSRSVILNVVAKAVEDLWEKSYTLSAASHCLMVNDARATVELLNRCGEYDLAFAISKCFGIPVSRSIVKSLALRCFYLGDLPLAISVIRKYLSSAVDDEIRQLTASKPAEMNSFDVDIEVALLIARHKKSRIMAERETMLLENGLNPLHGWLQSATEMEAIGRDADAIGCYSVAGDVAQVSYLLSYFIFPNIS